MDIKEAEKLAEMFPALYHLPERARREKAEQDKRDEANATRRVYILYTGDDPKLEGISVVLDTDAQQDPDLAHLLERPDMKHFGFIPTITTRGWLRAIDLNNTEEWELFSRFMQTTLLNDPSASFRVMDVNKVNTRKLNEPLIIGE